MKVALIHEWLASRGGSEKVLEAVASLFPGAPVHALMHDPRPYQGTEISRHPVVTSFIQRLPFSRTRYRTYLPLMPLAIEQFDLDGFDVIFSSSHAVAKGVLTRADQLHISYVHTPMRYAWDLYHRYLNESRLGWGPSGIAARAILHYVRLWDHASADRVDVFLANSRYVAARIRKTYRREAEVIHPPVEIDRFRCDRPRDDFFLTVSRLVPYKRVDLIVQAFNQLGLPLIVIGGGPELDRLRAMAGPNVLLLGERSDLDVVDHLERCRAFVFAADEDFGITPVEAQAAGAPVIAYGHGGALETVIDKATGMFFTEQTASDCAAVVRFFTDCQLSFPPERQRQHAERFSTARFQQEIGRLIDREWTNFRNR